MGYINCRRLLTVGLLFFLILAAFAATSETWTMWVRARPPRPHTRGPPRVSG